MATHGKPPSHAKAKELMYVMVCVRRHVSLLIVPYSAAASGAFVQRIVETKGVGHISRIYIQPPLVDAAETNSSTSSTRRRRNIRVSIDSVSPREDKDSNIAVQLSNKLKNLSPSPVIINF